MGNSDTFPYGFFPFAGRATKKNILPMTPKREQYIDQSVRVSQAIIEDWNFYYPFSWVQDLYPVQSKPFRLQNKVLDTGYYSVLNVPYKYVPIDIID
mmetsp:Transcript_15962/g.21670  ORF Transcript_15962/g.21670 Transcript_15962/m.21670 type:complete len:97 (+) Transcript_15962:849-1139(+)